MGMRVKPLEWAKYERHHESWQEVWSTEEDSFVMYNIWVYASTGKIEVQALVDEGYGLGFRVECDSVERGKQIAQQHWESNDGIGRYLEEVQPTDLTSGLANYEQLMAENEKELRKWQVAKVAAEDQCSQGRGRRMSGSREAGRTNLEDAVMDCCEVRVRRDGYSVEVSARKGEYAIVVRLSDVSVHTCQFNLIDSTIGDLHRRLNSKTQCTRVTQ